VEKEAIVEGLHPIERALVPHLKKDLPLNDLVKLSKLQEVEVTRGLQWLTNKKIVSIDRKVDNCVKIGENGKRYLKEGLPEKRFLEVIKDKPNTLDEIRKKSGLTQEEVKACIGLLRKDNLISLKGSTEGTSATIVEGANNDKIEQRQNILSKIKDEPLLNSFSKEEQKIIESLLKRKGIVETVSKKIITIKPTALGIELSKTKLDKNILDKLTPELLQSGGWKGKSFRRYDLSVKVPSTWKARKHFVREAMEEVRRIWLDLGFTEMAGPMLNPSFWNFDALFTAQDHPVREIQDTFFVDGVSGSLPDPALIKKVKEMHESGGDTGSTGWGGKWSAEEAKRVVLRTHTTVLSARTIAKLRESDLPAKFFSVGRCFRNEALDWSHLFEFNQTEGIVIDEDANFRHLLGYLKSFFKKMGFPKARFRPAYFPYTEPSVEIDVYHPGHEKWIELGGAGIFRPEVVIPLLGKDVPVLAWGPGFDRIIMDYYKIKDIRTLYSNDLDYLRKTKAWLR